MAARDETGSADDTSLRLVDEDDAGGTRSRILEAAFRRLAEDGYSALSVRQIARDAGVNHALINYHFRTKDQLVIDVLDAANRRLLARQKAMYGGPGTFAEKWQEARRFYESDLASGFVRVQAELWAASFSNADLRRRFVPRVTAWKKLVREGVAEALAAYEAHGGRLPPLFTADVIASWIAEFWLGMEFTDLLDVRSERAQHRDALDAVQWLLERLDASVAAPAEAPSPMARKPPARKRR